MKKEDMRNNNVTEENPNRKLPIIIGSVVAAVLVIVIIAIVLITSSAKTPQPEVNTATTVAEEPAPAPVVEEATEPEVQEATEEENVSKEVEFIKPNEWVASLNLTDVTPFIWNYQTAEGTIISEGESYVITEQQRLYIYSPKQVDYFETQPQEIVSEGQFGEGVYLFGIETENQIDVNIKTLIGDASYSNQFKVTREDFIGEEVNNNEQSLEEWLNTLGDDVTYPTFVVWNEKNSSKTIIENGGEYTWQEGDQLVYYTKSKYNIFGKVEADFEVTTEVISMSEKVNFDATLLKERQEIKLVAMSLENSDVVNSSIIILKPTE